MLERLAAYFLNTYVAEYVGNVVTDQLTIGWRGESIVKLAAAPASELSTAREGLLVRIN